MKRALAGLGLVLALAACDGGGDPVEQALRETAAANHAATVREGEVTNAANAASGAGDEAYVAEMIEYHRRAMAMADTALAESSDPEIRRMAQAVKDSRTREIAALRAWKPVSQPAR